jgi:hypothetical protein
MLFSKPVFNNSNFSPLILNNADKAEQAGLTGLSHLLAERTNRKAAFRAVQAKTTVSHAYQKLAEDHGRKPEGIYFFRKLCF